jgi:carbon storage regulator
LKESAYAATTLVEVPWATSPGSGLLFSNLQWALGSKMGPAAAIRATSRRNKPMLVLSRKKNESIVINNDITIVVVEIRGDKVRLGVEAPKEVPVHRREVYDAIRRNDVTAQSRASANGGTESGTSSANS